jgi:hypothetical protein
LAGRSFRVWLEVGVSPQGIKNESGCSFGYIWSFSLRIDNGGHNRDNCGFYYAEGWRDLRVGQRKGTLGGQSDARPHHRHKILW